MQRLPAYTVFRIDPSLSGGIKKKLEHLFQKLQGREICEIDSFIEFKKSRCYVDFLAKTSVVEYQSQVKSFRFCILEKNEDLFGFGLDLENSAVDFVLDELIDEEQIFKILGPVFQKVQTEIISQIKQSSHKSFKRIENLLRKDFAQAKLPLSSDGILNFSQALVDFEKELIHIREPFKLEKSIKAFSRLHLNKVKLKFYSEQKIIEALDVQDVFLLPPFADCFMAMSFNLEDSDFETRIKFTLLYGTLLNVLLSFQTNGVAFNYQNIWELVLDTIPFPVVLLGHRGEICQHNKLFSRLNLAPEECFRFNLRQKIVVQDIPYNIFRKEIHHLDEIKILLVFFTESIFLKGGENLTPTGQELGIISSSIAHELNNPIAGVQAALSVLQLSTDLNSEAMTTLQEMESGANRCKQLIETFLGFSRVSPGLATTGTHQGSHILLCYQQAQNLLRFRTVESGIRLSLEYSCHSSFRAGVNISLLTMTFYLILGELMTCYSHHLLVLNKNQIEKVIKGEIIESSQEIQVQLHELNISGVVFSKLIMNLLTIEHFVLQATDYSLRFIYTPPKDV